MKQVLIISKTKKGKTGVCVGGITLPDLQSVRVMKANGEYHKLNTPYEIGQVWEMDFIDPKEVKPPHVENVWVQKEKLIKKEPKLLPTINNAILAKIVWKGAPSKLFDGKLNWTGNRNGYVSKAGIPKSSTGFWESDQDLVYDKKTNHYYYDDGKGNWNSKFGFKYVGFEEPIATIKAGTMLRVSLATWWAPDDIDIEVRCYLQLSGWYDK